MNEWIITNRCIAGIFENVSLLDLHHAVNCVVQCVLQILSIMSILCMDLLICVWRKLRLPKSVGHISDWSSQKTNTDDELITFYIDAACECTEYTAGRTIRNISRRLIMALFARIRQITVADPVGPEVDQFLLKVQEASSGWPWYIESPSLVRTLLNS